MVDKRKNPVKVEGSQKRLLCGKEKAVEKPITSKVRPLYRIASLDMEERKEFCKTLDRMGLRGLVDFCWDFDDQDMVDEVYLSKTHPKFKNTIGA
jgi:hypothetical protein